MSADLLHFHIKYVLLKNFRYTSFIFGVLRAMTNKNAREDAKIIL